MTDPNVVEVVATKVIELFQLVLFWYAIKRTADFFTARLHAKGPEPILERRTDGTQAQ